MKKEIVMLALMLPMVFVSCSDDEEPSERIKIAVSQDEIQGTWGTENYTGYLYLFFTGNSYTYRILEPGDKYFSHTERGTYTIEGFDITFHRDSGESELREQEIYWEDNHGNYLRLSSIGTFLRIN